MKNKTITIARGDGIGPEIMDATLRILVAAEAPLNFEEIKIGERVYKSGHTSGIEPGAWDVIRRNKVLLKAPITTPQGGGYKSLNVTIRKSLNLFANIRPTQACPYVKSAHPNMDLVIVRENEEDLYAGIEHQQTNEVTQVLKLITRPGCEKIIRYAFEYARVHGRKKVTCMTKDNIMKLTDGLFHKVFNETAKEYQDIQADHQIIDIGAAKLAATPEQFDVIVTSNLYGDILSDIASQIAGSVGLSGSANIGQEAAMFEAIHGSAPDIAGKNIANPSGLLMAAVQMLVHLGFVEVAEKINNAWLSALEDGFHTADILQPGKTTHLVTTTEFADAVIKRLSKKPQYVKLTQFKPGTVSIPNVKLTKKEKTLVGVDVFLDWDKQDRNPDILGKGLDSVIPLNFKLKMITNRGVKVYPNGMPETFCTDHWRCRFVSPHGKEVVKSDLIQLIYDLNDAGFDIIKTENLYEFNGERGYSLGQGE